MRRFLRALRVQIQFLLGQKGFALVFLILMGVMLLNFTENVLEFRGYDVISMYHPMKLLTLSYNKAIYRADNAMLLIQLVPLFICLPAALSLAGEQQTGQSVLLTARLGSKTYLWSKVTAVFVVTTLAFAVPFLLEIGLNCVSFPLDATGDFYNGHAYSQQIQDSEAMYQMLGLYRLSPYLYAVVCTLLFGAFAGLLPPPPSPCPPWCGCPSGYCSCCPPSCCFSSPTSWGRTAPPPGTTSSCSSVMPGGTTPSSWF